MRVVVMTDTIGAMSSAQAGAVLACGWPTVDVTVIPAGAAGGGFAQAMADAWRVDLSLGVVANDLLRWAEYDDSVVAAAGVASVAENLPLTATSFPLGAAVRSVLEQRARPCRQILLDCAGLDVHDGGAGFLAVLGAVADVPLDGGVAALTGIASLDLDPVHEFLGGAQVVGVVPADQLDQLLLGLRGITSLRGRVAGLEPEVLLTTDAALEHFAALIDPQLGQRRGAGACGGVGAAILALGGRLATGPALALETAGSTAAVRAADLVVTGCSVFDFASRGGGVVGEAARMAAESLAPCIAVAGEVLIGGREMRTMGIESAYAVRESSMDQPVGGDVTEAELAAVVARVARSWRW